MTRKIDPLVVVSNRPRRSSRERLVGLSGGQSSRLKQSVQRGGFPTHNPDRGGASTSGPSMSAPPLGEYTRDDDVVVPGSDHVADPPSQQLRPASMTMVTSLSPPAQVSAPLSSRAALAATAAATAAVTAAATAAAAPSLSEQLPSLAPLSISSPLSPALSRKSHKPSQNEQLSQGPVYHVLVVDDSTMTRKMLMKTLHNGGIIHSINTYTEHNLTIHPLNTPSQRIRLKYPPNTPNTAS